MTLRILMPANDKLTIENGKVVGHIADPSINPDGTLANPTHWQLYKKFSKNWYVFPGHPCEIVLYPALPKANFNIIQVEYKNTSASEVKFFVNAFLHADLDTHKGEDW